MAINSNFSNFASPLGGKLNYEFILNELCKALETFRHLAIYDFVNSLVPVAYAEIINGKIISNPFEGLSVDVVQDKITHTPVFYLSDLRYKL